MPRNNSSEPMDVDPPPSTSRNGRRGGGGGGGPPPRGRSLTDIYAQQYEEAQKLLQEGATSEAAVKRVGELLQESVVLCKQEKKVRESLFGGSVLSLCAQISKNQAMALDTNLTSFDINTYAEGLKNYVFDRVKENHDWSRMAERSRKLFKRTPTFSYMYGAFKVTEAPPKPMKERAPRRQTQKAAEAKKPEKVTNVVASDEGNDKAVQHLKRVLKRHFRNNGNKPICFFECVLNPYSFHLTVENIFHLSFLMKNSFCAVRQENGGLPYIHQVSASEVSELHKGKKLQCIASISPEMWETLIKVFEIKEPMVPPMS